MRKALIVPAVLVVALLATAAATYVSTVTDMVVTGEGSQTANIAEYGFGANQNAALQVSRNTSGVGQGQGSAIDAYAGPATVGAFIQRWWIDNSAVDGGRQVATMIDSNGAIRTTAYEIISGLVTNTAGPASLYLPLAPTTDSSMFEVQSDVAVGAAQYNSVCPTSLCGTPPKSAEQAFVAMDGTGANTHNPADNNVRFAIDGTDGRLRWTNSTSNTFDAATWDVDTGRIAANIIGSSTTSIQTPHLDQPAGKHDIAGTIAIAAGVSGAFTFNVAYTAAPICVLSPTSNPGGLTWWVTTTAAAATAHLSAAGTVTFNYHCVGNPN